jgi:hypothetical protein
MKNFQNIILPYRKDIDLNKKVSQNDSNGILII